MFGGHFSLSRALRGARRAWSDLEAVPVRAVHDVEDALDVLERHVLVEEVAHRVDEDCLRLLPSQRELEHVRLQRQLEAVAVVRLTHRLQSLRHALGVAVLAAGANLRAAGDGFQVDSVHSMPDPGPSAPSLSKWFAIRNAIPVRPFRCRRRSRAR